MMQHIYIRTSGRTAPKEWIGVILYSKQSADWETGQHVLQVKSLLAQREVSLKKGKAEEASLDQSCYEMQQSLFPPDDSFSVCFPA